LLTAPTSDVIIATSITRHDAENHVPTCAAPHDARHDFFFADVALTAMPLLTRGAKPAAACAFVATRDRVIAQSSSACFAAGRCDCEVC